MHHVVLVLPRSGKPRAIGPFATEGAARAWVSTFKDDATDYLVQPLEAPSPHTYGAHARMPSPTPRQLDDMALAAQAFERRWQEGDRPARPEYEGQLRPVLDHLIRSVTEGGKSMDRWIYDGADELPTQKEIEP